LTNKIFDLLEQVADLDEVWEIVNTGRKASGRKKKQVDEKGEITRHEER
jgi:hypothetical protein